MADIKDVAVACWRLEKWLASAEVDKKMAAKSSLRTISSFLKDNRVETQDITGWHFDSGLNVDVINNESPGTPDEELVIREMVKPIVLQDGAVIARGSVILASEKDSSAVVQNREPQEPVPTEADIHSSVDTNKIIPEPEPKTETNDAPQENGFFKSIVARIRKIGSDIIQKETWLSLWALCKKHSSLLFHIVILLLLIIILCRTTGIMNSVQNNTVPNYYGEQTNTTYQESLPDGVTVTEDADRNIYINITNK